jgi:hypothetical protein
MPKGYRIRLSICASPGSSRYTKAGTGPADGGRPDVHGRKCNAVWSRGLTLAAAVIPGELQRHGPGSQRSPAAPFSPSLLVNGVHHIGQDEKSNGL